MAKRAVDKVRASRDGHEFHEAWTARKAMQLLWPDSDLTAIAVEGPSPRDHAKSSAVTVEVADLTFYYGGPPTFEKASRTTFAQFKYSIADQTKDFRAYHAKKTVQKFAATYRSYKRKYGARSVEEKLDFQLVTNQPVAEALLQAVDAIADGSSCKGDIREQARQFTAASGLSGKPLAAFARKLKLIGRSRNLPETKNELASLLVDWSATNDAIAAARLGKLRELVRDKAGYAGTDRNLIMRTDVLAALQVGDPEDLLPCVPALVDVGEVLERAQLGSTVTRIAEMSLPLLIHASGGVGKTVFMETLAAAIASDHEVVFFDCFGGGAYRSPEDARHLPRRGAIHIANTLAFRGLCDPMLPDSPDVHTLLRTFHRRLTQCVSTISRMTPGRTLAIFVDAVDNAVFAASQSSEDCFPIKLAESLDTTPIEGVKLILSCRTERRPKTYAKLDEIELLPFTKDETAAFLGARLGDITAAEINVAQARSGGNPRVLDYLLKAGRGLLDATELKNTIELEDLIEQRIADALSSVTQKGYDEDNLSAFLAGLAVLPPPVPVDEYATAHGMETAAIESFASDLSPLLERTNHGLMFRDEPIETFVHDRYATSREALERVASNLLARQDASVYAARALPRLLHELGDGEQLFALAFDKRIPASIASTVGRRNIQYARLKAATLHAALETDYNSLVRLLVELSSIAAVDQRGASYILDHPDLVVAAKDLDARRRLFETRTPWPGTRHARLAIANILSGEPEEAYRHVAANNEWIQHYRRTERSEFRDEPTPHRADIATTTFVLISEGRSADAARYLKGWLDWYSFEVFQVVIGYSALAELLDAEQASQLEDVVGELASIGPLAALLSFHDLSKGTRKEACRKLARLCRRHTKLQLPYVYTRSSYSLEDGLRKSAAVAFSLGLKKESKAISMRARHGRPGVWSYRDAFRRSDVFPYIFRVALLAAAAKKRIHEKDLLPRELVPICARISRSVTGTDFRDKARETLSRVPIKSRFDEESKQLPANAISHDDHYAAERFLTLQLEPLLALTQRLSAVLAASSRTIDKRFVQLVKTWDQVRKNRDQYSTEIDLFFHFVGLDAVLFVLWARSELSPSSVQRLLTAVHAHNISASDAVRIVDLLSKRSPLRSIAGEQAIKARELIDREDDINYRASLYGALGRAMIAASIEEAAVYFRHGLEQMDAIGSGDYQFTNELLLFASEMRGEELDERAFHTLSNICELNMGEEPEKFPWGAFGRGMAKAAGIRGLAKVSRWDDRDKISLNHTLLPYLTGLLEAEKLEPLDAICINGLANPVEYYFAGTKEFAKALRSRGGPDPDVIAALIAQFEDNNPTFASTDTIGQLHELAEEALGATHELSRRLVAARRRYNTANEGRNRAYRTDFDSESSQELDKRKKANREELARITAATDPTDETSLGKAIDDFNSLGNMYDLKDGFFSALRHKVPFAKRGQYVRNVAKQEHLYFYWKLAELRDAKEAWSGSSAALAEVYKGLALPLMITHANDLVKDGRFSGASIKEVSEFTGVSMASLVVEVIKVFSRLDSAVPGSVWLAFATFICEEADEGQGQIALTRLLASESATPAHNVADGPWDKDAYPPENFVETAAGLIWRVLGSPHAVDRWRAAHCIRQFADFGRWEVVDGVVARLGTKSAASFQAPDLAFYYLHARLWLAIALARAAVDHPRQIARYRDQLLGMVVDKAQPHVLMRHFAAIALLNCIDQGTLVLPPDTLATVRSANVSPYERLREKQRKQGFYQGRPESAPKSPYEFHLEYDFRKHDVDNLSRVFGRACWEVDDLIAEIVHNMDPAITAMYDLGGRESRGQHPHEMTSSFHGYGQHLGWHALFIAAGQLLAAHPVTDDWWYEDDPWKEWIGRYQLTREDGLWLSDGTDRTPYDASVALLVSTARGLGITGDQKEIMGLAGLDIDKGIGKELVIHGRWHSSDGIRIGVSSALVPPKSAAKLARKLVREKPILAWLPAVDASEDSEHLNSDRNGCSPWIVCPSGEAHLDECDPYGVSVANLRPYLAHDYSEFCKLIREDPFGRGWRNSRRTQLRAEAWGRDGMDHEDGPHPGLRLICETSLLKKVLAKYDKELLVLLNLQRYEEETYRSRGRFSHSIAVVRIDRSLNHEYFRGHVNHLRKP